MAGFRFTEASVQRVVEAVRRGDESPGYWLDSGTNLGLWIYVGPRGGTYKVIRRQNGRSRTTTLGPVATLSVKTARERATQLATGHEPDQRRRGRSRNVPAGEVFEQYMVAAQDGTFQPGHRPLAASTAKSYVELWRPHIAKQYGERPLSELADDITRIHKRLAAKPAAQKRLMQVLKNVFTFATRNGLWDGPNPVIDQSTGKAIACRGVPDRERFLSNAELERFIEFAQNAEEPWGDFLMLAIITGQRLGKLCEARWQEIDLTGDAPQWRLAITKNGRPLVVPLLPDAVTLLKHRRNRASENAKYVFPSDRSNTGHIVNPYHYWKRMLEETGIEDFRFHDVRRTAGTLGVKEHSLPAVARYLGHRTLRSVSVYARASDVDARKVGGTVTRLVRKASQ